MSEVSGTSYANSIAATNELRVPNIPKEYIDGPFLCPICHTLIIVNDRNSWKKHVFRDLQPYVCLFDNCSSPSQVYQRRKDWIAHMKQEHWVSWSCSFGCSKSFRSQESFEKHVTTVHGQNFESIDFQAVLNLCRFPSDTNTVGICPFCFDYEIKSDKSYQSHIGDHLERLALFVLPKTLYDDDSVDDDNNEEDGEGDNNDDGVDSDIEMRLVKDDEYSDHLQGSHGSDSEENEGPDEGNTKRTHKLMDYGTQLMLLEEANKKRLMMARQAQSEMEEIPQDIQPDAPAEFIRQPSPDTSPQTMRSGASPEPDEQMNDSSIHDSWENEELDEDNTERMHPLMDYMPQLMQLEEANKKRLMMARQEQSKMEGIPQDSQSGPAGSNNGQPFPDTSPQETRSESSPTFEEIDREMSRMNNSGIHDSRRDEELNKGNTESAHPLMDYMPRLLQLEQENKKRLMRARQEQSEMEGILRDGQPSAHAGSNRQPSPDISPIAAKSGASGASPNLKDRIRRIISQMDNFMDNYGSPSPNPDDEQSLESPEENVGQAQMNSMNPPSKKVSFAKGKNIAVLPSTTLKYREDSPDSHPDSQGSAMRRSTGAGSPPLSPSFRHETLPPSIPKFGFPLDKDQKDLEAKAESLYARSLKRYGSLSTFHGEGPIETSPTSAPRADGTDTIVPRPRDYSETQRLKEEEDAAEAAEFAAEQRRLEEQSRRLEEQSRQLEEQSRQLKELKRESDIVVEKRRKKEIEYRRLKEEDSADAAEKMRQLEQEFRDEADLHDLQQQLDAIKMRDARAELSRRLKELDRVILKNDEEAAEEMRRLERKFPDEVELHYARQELDAIKKREANAEMERRILKERELLRLEEEDAAEAAEEQRRVGEPLRQLEELKRESDIVVEQRINKEAEYRRLKEEDSADAAERIRIVSGMLRDDAELRSLQRKLDATQKREAGAIEKRILKEPELRRLIEEEYASEAAEGKRRLEGDFREDGESSKEEDQVVPMDWDSIEPPFTDGVMEVEKRRGSAAPPGRCHSCNRIVTTDWRRGPDGARTLCNACGRIYARKRRLEARSLHPKPEERS
ncbi:GATA zinc finger domain-containing protein [Trichoderma breve]|uniref:GATA zinc finger domain-containing protein n=1 Tax=Trichoderma breve TaxID=2034170 RepID=A0A9W9BE16_9HYPO|nr:GATA zinc finger domain-containing protein [Trichoderma breve]KAJ4861567.1 GATA zinc finger domain-containing protein [Trichoderma breve]